jgi:hypothetical protein
VRRSDPHASLATLRQGQAAIAIRRVHLEIEGKLPPAR